MARAIHKLGGEVAAIYPSGGYSGKFLNILIEKEGVYSKVIETREHTRENLIVLDKASNLQYRFGMPGQELQEDEWISCMEMVRSAAATYVVASGSLPPGVPDDILAQIAGISREVGSRFVVDSSGIALKLALEKGAYLMKPNINELTFLAGKEELGEKEVVQVARDLVKKYSCEIMVVSLGALGAILVTRNEVYKVASPRVEIKSTVGAGDSMVAGLVLSLARGNDLLSTLQFGVACGTAATMSPGTQLCNKQDAEKIMELIKSDS